MRPALQKAPGGERTDQERGDLSGSNCGLQAVSAKELGRRKEAQGQGKSSTRVGP